VAELLVDVLQHEGVEARLVETPSDPEGSNRAAVWAIVPGTGERRPVVLLSHLDVVAADEGQWAVDPFAGVVGGGYVVGRGALDAKGLAVVHAMTLALLARRDEPLDRDVILLATPGEETGGGQGSGYIVRHRRELLRDAEFLLTEGGGILVGDGRGLPVWGVSVNEKAPCWIRLRAQGTPGHGSTPQADAAVPRLVAALERVRRLETEVRVVPDVARMFEVLSEVAPLEDREGLLDLQAALDGDADFRARFLTDPGRSALVRDTIAITVLEGSSSTNVIPAEAVAHLDGRLLPGETCEVLMHQIREAIDDPEIHLEPLLAFRSVGSRVDTDLFRAIEQVAGEIDAGAPVVPRVIAGFTDAHYFRELGIVSYGFVPRWLPPSETRGIHGPNERVSIQNLEKGVRTLVRILEVLGSPR
jgi:acetylornithine deacetylase/succinyl-diaminopimelate desuccinylase-like protein